MADTGSTVLATLVVVGAGVGIAFAVKSGNTALRGAQSIHRAHIARTSFSRQVGTSDLADPVTQGGWYADTYGVGVETLASLPPVGM